MNTDQTNQTKTSSGSDSRNDQNGKIAVVLVRGMVKSLREVKATLEMLNLDHKNHCVILENNPVNLGMIKRVKDYVTWGVIDPETFNRLLSQRGKEFQSRLTDSKGKYSYKVLEVSGKKYKPYFSLNPPRKGFGRKGIKVAFKAGGGLGDRGEKINDLIQRML
ncbi:MAG TPA: uL30 family ribosomal protein [Candidatus Nanoarchaeia archaeon]|nr:uL30 family ribosomal protein [Candidatus Nanoarchaeia archaeon]